MNKAELIEITAKGADISKAAAGKALDAAMAAIVKSVAKGDPVTLRSEERRVGKEWRSRWAQDH